MSRKRRATANKSPASLPPRRFRPTEQAGRGKLLALSHHFPNASRKILFVAQEASY
jgi:hypothetical protein